MKRPKNIELAPSYDLLEYIYALEELAITLRWNEGTIEDLEFIDILDQTYRPRMEPLDPFPDGYKEQ
jgi:hypothetical protein